MSADLYAGDDFEAFWPRYVALHSRRETQLLHALGSVSFASLVVAAVLLRAPVVLLLAPLADHTIAQVSHRLFEKNRTTPWRRPLWHARAEARMLGLTLRGRMRREVEACEALRIPHA